MNASIVIYKTNIDYLTKLLQSLDNSIVKTIYIIDNFPAKETEDYTLALSPKVEYIASGKNIGYGAGHNIAIRKSIAEGLKYHLVLNPDIELNGAILEELKAFMDREQDAGMVMPKVFFPNGAIQYLCKLLPTPLDLIGRRFLPSNKYIQERNDKFELRGSGYDKIMNIPYLSGCFMLFRIDVLKEVGLFDEHIFMYGEDTDITRRIHQKHQTLFYPKASIIHHYNKESYRSSRMLRIHIKSAFYYFNKWGWFFDKARRKINKAVVENYLGALLPRV